MRNSIVVRAVLAAAFIVVSVETAGAQIYESVGIRAQGMGGAFVAVADDATATWWNPAGLAGGAYVSSVFDYGFGQDPRLATGPGGAVVPAWRVNTRGIAVGYPALGLSYYRLQVSQIQSIVPIGGDPAVRQDPGLLRARESVLELQQFGATFGQSIGNHFVVGSTLKLVHGGAASAIDDAAVVTLERASELSTGGETHADLDLGAMLRFGIVSIGGAVKNVLEPSFGSGADEVALKRQGRVGLALMSGKHHGTQSAMSLAFDADVTRTVTATGEVRHIAVGAEGWLYNGSLGLRGGFSANTIGAARPAAGAGLSVALRKGTYVDGQTTFGADDSRSGWAVGLRVTF